MTILPLVLHFLRIAAPYAAPCVVAAAVARAFWEGARREVVRFGEDVAAIVFGLLRRLLRMSP